jgi:polyphosphate kinase
MIPAADRTASTEGLDLILLEDVVRLASGSLFSGVTLGEACCFGFALAEFDLEEEERLIAERDRKTAEMRQWGQVIRLRRKRR